MTRKERFAEISKQLELTFPQAEYELHFQSPYQLLVAITLAARCTDQLVNELTPSFFLLYPTLQALSSASQEKLLPLIAPVTHAEAKAQYLIDAAKAVMERFNGKIPTNEIDLMKLPGIGRKSANALLAHALGQPAIVVDTHVARVSQRLKIASCNTPDGIERELTHLIDRQRWIVESNRLTLLGRRICTYYAPQCNLCPVAKICQTPIEENHQLSLF